MTNYQDRIYIVSNDNCVSEMSLGEYLREYHSDEWTTPDGIRPDLFVSPTDGGFEVRSYRATGRVRTYDSEEDAELFILGRWYARYQLSCDNTPPLFYSRQEADAWINESPF